MLTSEDVAQWTNELIDSEIESGELSNILRICDDNFELWTQKLFPILQAQGKPCYKAVVMLLHRAGCTNANEKMLGSYFTYLRKKRGLTKATGRVPLNHMQPSLVVPTAVDVSSLPGAVPIVPPSSSPAGGITPVNAAQTSPPRAASELPAPDTEEFNVMEELDRLNEEAKHDFQEGVSPRDVQLLHYFDGIRKTYPLMQSMINSDGAKMSGDMMDVNVKDLFSLIKMKFRSNGVKFEV